MRDNGTNNLFNDQNIELERLWWVVKTWGVLPLWRWHGYMAPKTPYFQRCCHPMTPYFCWLSLLSPKDPTFFVKCGLFHCSHPKTPLCDKSFLPFLMFFLQIPAFRALTDRSKVTFSPNAPWFWTKIWLLTQWPLIFWDYSHRMPSLWKCVPYTRIHLILESLPPPVKTWRQ